MSKFFDNMAWVYRVAQAMMAVIVLGSLLAWAVWQTGAERVEYRELSGRLLEIRGGDDKTGKALLVGKIQLPDGNEIKLILPRRQPLPKVGDPIPLTYERYDDDSAYYFYDARF